jgi:ABC-type phosphate/phosphonate transport system substrate-binding protein
VKGEIVPCNNVSRWLALLVLCSSCSWPSWPSPPAAVQSQPQPGGDITFISIVADEETKAADTRLKKFLQGAIGKSIKRPVRFPQQTMPYGEVIRAFTEPAPGKGYLARITPYAYVAAEMLGAQLDILGTYTSAATGKMTYHSYFVVPKEAFNRRRVGKRNLDDDATLEELLTYLRNLRDKPATFIYHDRFSTSSYFLPSLYFKENNIFAMSQSLNPELIPIRVSKMASASSGVLVTEVANERADLAAVWDGTKDKYQHAPPDSERAVISKKVLFIPIPTLLPNDFLVASGLNVPTKEVIVEAMRGDPSADRDAEHKPPWSDDFKSWHAWDSNDSQVPDDAREALARLRQRAHERAAPVVVRVEAKGKNVLPEYVDAAREAVRLSGTEFVLEDKDLHKSVDMTWTLESTHDRALKLTSTLDPTFGRSDEVFWISFVDRNDLPKRIADLARSRLRRIRYVWPYEEKYPVVLRDLDFTPARDVLVQKINWMDPTRNEYEQDTPFHARIEDNTDFSKFRLSDDIKFPRNSEGAFNFDPMSSIAYRVIMSREPHAGWIWIALPYSFIGLFILACIGFAADVRRRQPPPKGLLQTYQRMVEAYHRPWRQRQVEEGEILWADLKYMDELVKELKLTGSPLDVVRAGGFDFNFGPIPVRLSVLMRVASQMVTRTPQLSSELIESSGGGSVAALDTLIQFLVRRRRLSPFVGFPECVDGKSEPPASPMEWQALSDIAARHFQRLGIGQKQVVVDLGPQNDVLSAVVSSHFQDVIRKGTHAASLFCQTWNVQDKGVSGRLVCEQQIRSALALGNGNGNGHRTASRVRVEVTMPGDAVLYGHAEQTALRAWVFGRILTWSVDQETLSLQVKPIAILREYAQQ